VQDLLEGGLDLRVGAAGLGLPLWRASLGKRRGGNLLLLLRRQIRRQNHLLLQLLDEHLVLGLLLLL